jgi:hypothetical protein
MLSSKIHGEALMSSEIQNESIEWLRRRAFYFCLLPFAFCLLIFLSGCSRKAQLESAQAAWDGGDYAGAAERYEEFLKQNPQGDKPGDVTVTTAEGVSTGDDLPARLEAVRPGDSALPAIHRRLSEIAGDLSGAAEPG